MLYRVYLAALVGGSAVLIASDWVDDTVVTAEGVQNVADHGPGVVGLVAVVAAAAGLRSGSNGGPVAVENGDVAHLLLAPIPRSAVLRQPVLQRLRSLTFIGVVVGAIAGQLASRRLPGSAVAWTASTAGAIGCSLLLFGAVAVIAHAVRLPRPAATAIGAALITWQAAAAADVVAGPGDPFGGLAMWGMRQHLWELASVILAGVVAVAAVVLCGRLRVEPLLRRATLVSQLRFAVTTQDLRTVILLRRQLRNEHPRMQPWLQMRPVNRHRAAGTTSGPIPVLRRAVGRRSPVVRRGWQSFTRIPLARVARTATLAIAGGVAAVATVRGTTPAAIGIGAALFAMSLEVLEPLSQEVDHPDRTDALPISRDRLMAQHLVVPAVVLVPFALLGAAVVTILEPDAAAAAFCLAIPVAWVGACGAVVSTVRDMPDPVARNSPMVPPEFAGFSTAMRVLIPLAISTLAAVPVVALREDPTTETAGRSLVGLLLVAGACSWWVSRRDRYRTSIRSFMNPQS